MDTVKGPSALASIKFLSGPLAGETYQVNKPSVTIGREPGNDVVINHPSISRHHVQLNYANGVWTINKLAAQNTMTVNQRDVQQVAVRDRDTVGLGADTTTFLFQVYASVVQASPPPPVPPPAQQARPQKQAKVPIDATNIVPPPPNASPTAFALPPNSQPPLQTVNADLQRATLPEPLSVVGLSIPAGTPTLEVSSNIDRQRQFYPLSKPVIGIGRDPANDIVINRPTVSGFHAQIVREGNQLVFVHPPRGQQRTTNGITYQGQTIPGDGQYRKALVRGDVLRIIDDHGTFVTLTYNDGSGAAQDVVPEIHPIELNVPVLTIGREVDNTVRLDHPLVSGHHARLEQVQGTYRIIDMGSTNHVYVNGRQVSHQTLNPGDEIRIGPYRLTFTGTQLTQHDESGSIRIDALNLKKVGNKQTVLINDISLVVPPRKFVALVGGSGAGKSTLMDALNGLRPAQEGAVLYNGQDYYRNLAAFSTQLGYVPQEDIIHRDLTVERALYYAARLRLPSDFTKEQIKQRINEVLEDVEMKHRRGLLVSKLSGGQRKRVSIALELLANPNVFFLDEPTSGLDPGLDRKMMLLLRKLADKGHTIVLVTHATNNINACDYICFLCQGGRLAYYGPPDEAKAYFGKTDFAEIYSALEPSDENPNIPAQAETRYRQSKDYQKYVAGPLSQGPASRLNANMHTQAITLPRRGAPMKQFTLLSRRYIELLRNDVGNLLILLLQAPIIALILWFLIQNGTFQNSSVVSCHTPNSLVDTVSCDQALTAVGSEEQLQNLIKGGSGGDAQKILFIMSFAAVLFGSVNGVREIVKEVPIYRRERAVNLGIAPYMLSKIVVLGVLCLLQSGILVLVVNTRAPFEHATIFTSSPPLEIYITMCLTSLAGLMVGLTISAIAPNNDRAMSFLPIVLLPQVIFAGNLFPLTNPVLQFFGSLIAVRWSLAAMGSSIGLHSDKLIDGNDNFTYQGTLFSTFDQTTATLHLLLTWFALVAMIVLLGFVIAYYLKKKDVRA